MVTTQIEDGTLVIELEGRLDTACCLQLEEDIRKAREIDRDAAVALDLARVRFVSSAFLRICIALKRELGAGRVKVRNETPEVKMVFKIAGMDALIA